MNTQTNSKDQTCSSMSFENHMNIISKKFNKEKDLKNNAFSFLVNKGLYLEFHEWLSSSDSEKVDTTEARKLMYWEYIKSTIGG